MLGHIVCFQVCYHIFGKKKVCYHRNRSMSLQTLAIMQSSYSLDLCLVVISRLIALFPIDTPVVS